MARSLASVRCRLRMTERLCLSDRAAPRRLCVAFKHNNQCDRFTFGGRGSIGLLPLCLLTFFETIKAELIWPRSWETRRKGEMVIGKYIDGPYDPHIRH